jgi:hypothetical protein
MRELECVHGNSVCLREFSKSNVYTKKCWEKFWLHFAFCCAYNPLLQLGKSWKPQKKAIYHAVTSKLASTCVVSSKTASCFYTAQKPVGAIFNRKATRSAFRQTLAD